MAFPQGSPDDDAPVSGPRSDWNGDQRAPHPKAAKARASLSAERRIMVAASEGCPVL